MPPRPAPDPLATLCAQLRSLWQQAGGDPTALTLVVRQWLEVPSRVHLEKVEASLVRSQPEELRLSVPALRWLGLMDGLVERKLMRRLAALGETMPRGPEDRIIDQLMSWRASPSEVRLGTCGQDGPALERAIHSVLHSNPLIRPTRDDLIQVDLEHGRIFGPSTSGSDRAYVASPRLCHALELLRASPSPSFPHFAEAVFEVRVYDPWLHDHQIHNLLARLRAMVGPRLELRTRHKRIYALGDWKAVRWIARYPHRALRDSQIWRDFLEPPASSPLTLRQIRELFPDGMSRQQLQATLELSRSGAVRLLERLRKQGRMERWGRGKSTRYRIRDLKVP